MVTPDQLLPTLVAAFPLAGAWWDSFRASDHFPRAPYEYQLGEFATVVVLALKDGRADQLPPLWAAIERLYSECPADGREVLTGLMFDFRYEAGQNKIDPTPLRSGLGPLGLAGWTAAQADIAKLRATGHAWF